MPTLEQLRKPIGAVIIFAVSLLFGSLTTNATDSSTLAISLATSNLITMCILYWMGTIHTSSLYPKNIDWRHAHLGIMATIFGFLALDLFCAMLPLPDLMEESFLALARNPLGVLAMVFVAPIAEELIFRESVLGYMLRHGVSPWKGILFSALLFGLIHLNPAQIPFAFIAGILMGMVYVQSRSILLTSIIHILNNSCAVVEMNILGENYSKFNMVEALGGTVATCILIIIGFLLCGVFMHRFTHKYRHPHRLNSKLNHSFKYTN